MVTMNKRASIAKSIDEQNAANQVVIYSKTYCPYCRATKQLFREPKDSKQTDQVLTSFAASASSNRKGGALLFSVMGGNKATDRTTVRMNDDLDEEEFQLLELSEGYISRL